ncbi:hybrid sensor histidine kinase/response regulator [Hyalangium sp.]|uniref:hybrid sensor histidine kinase/response regulator n=1 Tax=Hyalangium sp. TaxID=2028555 RepID=UPI002D3F110E|nr:hybrid sensor histidine kinase/response regulator [Hyalangium sp.]HYH96319.1 hybrid sensor histidine kinase/response regulator [Hyalangium sp.]
MDPQVLRSIWPIFSAETREQIQAIGTKIMGLEEEPAGRDPDLLPSLKRLVHSLKGSAASLGLSEIEQVVHAIEDGLARFRGDEQLPREVVEVTLSGLASIEVALGRGDEGEEPSIDGLAGLLASLGKGGEVRTSSKEKDREKQHALERFRKDALQVLEKLEEALATLCSPNVPDRPSTVRSAVALARSIKSAAEAAQEARVAPLAEQTASGFSKMEQAGDTASIAASDLAGILVELRSALSPSEPVPAAPAPAPAPELVPEATKQAAQALRAASEASTAPAPTMGEAAGGAKGGVDQAVRVSVKTLESLGLQVEQLIAGRAQQVRRTDVLRDLLDNTHDTIVHLERSASHLSLTGGGESLESLRTAVLSLRSVQKRLVELLKEGTREGEQMNLVAQVVRDDLRDMRMVPAVQVLEPLRRTVREVSSRLSKQVELFISGGDVRLDRRILDALKDPLLHLVRNAIDHGIEMPDTRLAAGKNEKGKLWVRVEPRGTRIAVVVEDDGGGLSPTRVRATAVKRGLLSTEAAAKLSDPQAARLIFQPGFSTRDQVTETSGRGVGLDVVLATAQRLQGAVDVSYTDGQGTRFTIDLPLTLASALGLLIRVGTSIVAVPSDMVERVFRLAPNDVGTVAGRVVARVESEQLTFLSLSEAIGLPRLPLALESGKMQTVMLLTLGKERVLYAIDEVVGQQDIVVRTLGPHLKGVVHLAGAAVLDDGRLVPVLNAPELLRAAAPSTRGISMGEIRRPRILVTDDSLTTRFAMKSLLEIAGYPVVTASDGEEAWEVLERTPCQLVVSDWQMPRLDGVGLTRRIRSHPTLNRIPVILVTSLDSPEERAAGLEAGADGYLVKREVERGRLLDLVRQLVPG